MTANVSQPQWPAHTRPGFERASRPKGAPSRGRSCPRPDGAKRRPLRRSSRTPGLVRPLHRTRLALLRDRRRTCIPACRAPLPDNSRYRPTPPRKGPSNCRRGIRSRSDCWARRSRCRWHTLRRNLRFPPRRSRDRARHHTKNRTAILGRKCNPHWHMHLDTRFHFGSPHGRAATGIRSRSCCPRRSGIPHCHTPLRTPGCRPRTRRCRAAPRIRGRSWLPARTRTYRRSSPPVRYDNPSPTATRCSAPTAQRPSSGRATWCRRVGCSTRPWAHRTKWRAGDFSMRKS